MLSLQPVAYGISLVLCKNVLLHFQPLERIEVIKMFYAVLVPGGYSAMEQHKKCRRNIENFFERVVSGAQLFRKN